MACAMGYFLSPCGLIFRSLFGAELFDQSNYVRFGDPFSFALARPYALASSHSRCRL
jgi:hypothetical protein